MLKILAGSKNMFNEETMMFEEHDGIPIELEHSLLSLSKWEAKHKKPFLTEEPKTHEEGMAYILDMVVSPNPPDNLAEILTHENIEEVNEYIESSETATTFGTLPARKSKGEVITAELIYYWLVAFTIPFEVERWHLQRLFALIRICNIKNDPKGQRKMSRNEIAQRNRELNAQRLKQYGTRG